MTTKPSVPAWWFGARTVPLHARVLEAVYARVVGWRVALYRLGWLRSKRVDRPVLVVGNLVAGGSGKTPLTIAIVERLLAEGYRPGVATRGYGRRDASKPIWVDARTTPMDGGDEPVLIARQTGVKVRADRDRVAAAQALVAAGCDVVVCDDGLQHYRLQRDLEIEVIDARRRYGNGRLLPAGPLREPVERGADCDFRVLNLGTQAETGAGAATGTGASAEDGADGEAESIAPVPGFGEWPMHLLPGDAVPVGRGRPRPLSAFADQRVHAVAGIGDPERFFGMLRALGIGVVPHAFPDHHAYQAEDLRFGSDLPVLMTAKDAVKCADFANDRHYSVPIEAVLPEAFWVALLDRLRAAGGADGVPR